MRPLLRPLASHCASLRVSCAKTITTSTSPSSPLIPTPKFLRRIPPLHHQHRTFLPNLPLSSLSTPPSQNQSISATRTLPYPPHPLYTLISDIDAYSNFLPYVLSSTVLTRHPESHAPTSADLRIGFPPFDEAFTSKVTCIEPSLVAAESKGNKNGVFESVKTMWEIRPAITEGGGLGGGERNNALEASSSSVVDLKIEIDFTSPLYAALTSAVIPKMAGVMIDAFEKRAREVLGSPGEQKNSS